MNEEAKSKNKKIGIIIGCVVVLLILGYSILQPKIEAYQKEQQHKEYYQTGLDLLQQQKWSDAQIMFNNLDYKDSSILADYAYAKDAWAKGDKWNADLRLGCDVGRPVPIKDYKGDFAQDVKSFYNQMSTELDAEQAQKRANIAANGTSGVYTEPQIGMTKDEVLGTSWGKPDHINKTTTAYGTSEQWVYGTSRYVYFDNGTVTTIQN